MSRSPSPELPPLTDLELSEHKAVRNLREGAARRVVVLAGAGISVGAGIPDFRTPGTGLYDNLQKYNLSRPEDVFTLSYFRTNPHPFTQLAKEMWPSNFQPTPTHFFVRLLELKGCLLRHYTQNIDGLDRCAGVTEECIVEAHGSFGAGHCIDCQKSHSQEYIRDAVFCEEVARCSNQSCSGLVKPDIVFFGESLPQRFWDCSEVDFDACDLVICMGTSLQVQPFASLVQLAPKTAPRLLVNRELPESFGHREGDLLLLGDCDTQIWRLAEALGWADDLRSLVAGTASTLSGGSSPSSPPSNSTSDGWLSSCVSQ